MTNNLQKSPKSSENPFSLHSTFCSLLGRAWKRLGMESKGSYDTLWSDLWGDSIPDPVPGAKRGRRRGVAAKAKCSKKVEAKTAASTGMKKAKRGASVGLFWIKGRFSKAFPKVRSNARPYPCSHKWQNYALAVALPSLQQQRRLTPLPCNHQHVSVSCSGQHPEDGTHTFGSRPQEPRLSLCSLFLTS